jgi:hypothetical protein
MVLSIWPDGWDVGMRPFANAPAVEHPLDGRGGLAMLRV